MTLLEKEFVQWQQLLFALHLVSAVTVAVIVFSEHNKWLIPVESAFTVWSCNNTCVQSTYRHRHSATISVGGLVVYFSLISALHHWCMTNTRYVQTVTASGVNAARWADYSVSAALIFLVNSFMYMGHPSLLEIVCIVAVQFLIIVVGYASEELWANHSTVNRPLFLCASLAQAGVFGVQLYSFSVSMTVDVFNTTHAWPTHGPVVLKNNEPPALVYAFVAYVLLSFCAFPVVHLLKTKQRYDQTDENRILRYEATYGVLSFGAKIPLTCLYAAGTLARGQSDSDQSSLWAFGIGVLISVVLACCMRYRINKSGKKLL